MTFNRFVLLFALTLPAVHGEIVAQPVKEVDREARSAVQGSCFASLTAGSIDSNFDTCSFTTIGGAALPQAVPAGKILVIGEASARCISNSADTISTLVLGTQRLGFVPLRYIPLTIQATIGTAVHRSAFTSGQIYFGPGLRAYAQLILAAPAAQRADCSVRLSGHYVDVQP